MKKEVYYIQHMLKLLVKSAHSKTFFSFYKKK